jgi:zeaxanthin glucosyltransferase
MARQSRWYSRPGRKCVYNETMAPRHFLFVVFSDSGHLNPVISIAQYLESYGHEVRFFSLQEDVSLRVGRAGLRGRCASSGVAAIAAPKPEAQRSVKLGQRVGNKSWLKWWTNAVLVQQVPAQVAALRSVVRERRPDVIVADPLAYAAPVVAGLEGIPWAAVATGLQSIISEGEDGATSSVYREIAPARERMLAALGVTLEFRGSDAWSPWLNTVFALEGLVSSGKRPDALVVGPAVSLAGRGDERPFPFDKLPTDQPIVYIAFGSQFSHPPSVYEMFVAALGPEEAFFVLAVKDLIDDPFVARLPPHVLVVDYAPQLAVLERAAVMVSHGGANSVHECLTRGKPIVVVPLAYDQPLLAKLVERAGVGVGLDPAGLTVERCREVLMALIRPDAPERARARSLMEQAGNGSRRVAELLVSLAEARAQPL